VGGVGGWFEASKTINASPKIEKNNCTLHMIEQVLRSTTCQFVLLFDALDNVG